MTDSNWKPIPGYPAYEASDQGQIRSLDRTLSNGRRIGGVVLAPRRSNRGYLIVNLTTDGGKHTKSVHSLVLLAFRGPPPEGGVSRHLNDDQADNRLANLAYGTASENELDKFRNGRPKPVPPPQPPRACIRCGEPVDKGGRRCHACVVEIGEKAAQLFVARVPQEEIGKRLDYPAVHLLTLAQKYGRLRLVLAPIVVEDETQHIAQSSPRVMATLRHILRLGRR